MLMGTVNKPQHQARRALWAAGCSLSLLTWCSSVRADGLNPLDYSSLGSLVLPAGTYTLNTNGAAPILVGPVNLTGTVSISGVAIFCFDDLTVASGCTITATGTRAVAFLARNNMTFTGTLQASGYPGGTGAWRYVNFGGDPGPGGYSGGDGPRGDGRPGCGIGGGGPGRSSGGGGAGGGFGGVGGNGAGPGGVGGIANGTIFNVLQGGCGGGGGATGDGDGSGNAGGGGGGAIELGAIGALTMNGWVAVDGGAGGGNGAYLTGGAGGGGSGGGVFIHAESVRLYGGITAAGGASGRAGTGAGGGGGGGGWIVIQSSQVPVPMQTTNVSGGAGRDGGANGSPGQVVVEQAVLSAHEMDFGRVQVGTTKTAFLGIEVAGGVDVSINGQFPEASVPFTRVGSGVFSGLRRNRYIGNPYTFSPAAGGSFTQILTFLSDGGNASIVIRGVGDPRGDTNCDGRVDYGDINPFVLALEGRSEYEARFPDCDWHDADCDEDCRVTYADINPFVRLLSGP